MFGLIARFALRPEMVAEFDRVARETVAAVGEREPGTLAYAVHMIEGAPLTRLFYEIYRDRAAFQRHEVYEHSQRFQAAREACLSRPPDVEFVNLMMAAGLPATVPGA